MIKKILNFIATVQGVRQEVQITALRRREALLEAQVLREKELRVHAENALALAREGYWNLHIKLSALQQDRLRDMQTIQWARRQLAQTPA